MKSIFASALLLTLASPALAGPGVINGGASYTETSDKTEQTEIGAEYRNHRRDLFWPYAEETRDRWDEGAEARLYNGRTVDAHYLGARVSGLVAYRPSVRSIWDFQLGGSGFHNDYDGLSHSTVFGRADLYWRPLRFFDVHFRVNHDFIYQDFLQVGTVNAAFTAYSESVDFNFRLHPRWRIPFRGTVYEISDGNSRRDFDLGLMYGLFNSVPWIWIGFGGEYLSHAFQSTSYWSPHTFYDLGPRLEGDVPVSGDWAVFFGANLNRFKEYGFPAGTGYFGSLGVRYGDRNAFNFSLAYNRIRSAQNSGRWSSDQGALLVHVPL